MKPGLYVATVNGEPGAVVYGPMGNGQMVRLGAPWRSDGRVQYLASGSIADVRPLVVLDPESDEDCRRLADALNDMDGAPAWLTQGAAALLRALADPKPAEPTGLGAVVRDGRGDKWVLIDVTGPDVEPVRQWRTWWGNRPWHEIDVAEVLSEGWSE